MNDKKEQLPSANPLGSRVDPLDRSLAANLLITDCQDKNWRQPTPVDRAIYDIDRELFERWARTFQRSHRYNLARSAAEAGAYVHDDTHHAWIGWRAAAALARATERKERAR